MGLNTINDDFGGKKGAETTDNGKKLLLEAANVTAPGNSGQGDSAENWVEATHLSEDDAAAAAGKILEGTNGSSTPETGNDNGTPSEGETLETAKEKTTLELLLDVEKTVKEHENSSDPTIIALIKDYEDTKRSMNNLLSDSAKQALKQQYGIDLDDDNNNSIEETPGDRSGDTAKTLEDKYPSPKDAEKVKDILENSEKQKRVNDVREVMENKDKLTEEQKNVLNAELAIFKESLERIYLGLNVHDWIATAEASGKTPDTDPGNETPDTDPGNETPDTDPGVDNSSTPEDIQGGEGGRVEM